MTNKKDRITTQNKLNIEMRKFVGRTILPITKQQIMIAVEYSINYWGVG